MPDEQQSPNVGKKFLSLFLKGMNQRGSRITLWNTLGFGIPGVSGVARGFPALAVFAVAGIGILLFLSVFRGIIVYVVCLLVWVFMIWIVKSNLPFVNKERVRLLLTAKEPEILEGIDRQHRASVEESVRKEFGELVDVLKYNVLQGVVTEVQSEDKILVRVTHNDEDGSSDVIETYSLSQFSEKIRRRVVPGFECRIMIVEGKTSSGIFKNVFLMSSDLTSD